MSQELTQKKILTLPVLPIRGVPVFPYMIIHFDVGRERSVNAIEESMVENQLLFLLAQKNPELETITPDDLYRVGTIAKIKQVLKLSENDIRVLVEGVARGTVVDFTSTSPYFECTVEEYIPQSRDEKDKEQLITEDAYIREITKCCSLYFSLQGKFEKDAMVPISAIKEVEQFADSVCAALNLKIDAKQELLEEMPILKRLHKLLVTIDAEIEVLKIEKEIGRKVKDKIDKGQKEFFLREQIKVIQDELGEGEVLEAETDEYLQILKSKNAPEECIEKVKKEISRLKKMQSNNPDTSVTRNYIEYLCSLPWGLKSNENADLSVAEAILNQDHYGMEKVKERIVEFLAVRMLSGGKKSPIICLYGPPGVGKTSVAKSIARAMGRKYVRMSLGGVRDEAEIRGHRKTYIGAMPGRIISAVKQAGTGNPLVLLDEIDKVGADHRGNISAALLEVLDSEQNFSFRDHYVELEYDLSDVLFITTANSLDSIDRPLLDRMEVIELTGYTDSEKLTIAKDYIIPKQIKENGLKKSNVKISDDAVREIIEGYTRESGVRGLERKIGEVMRKVACEILKSGKKSVSVGKQKAEKLLGKRIFKEDDNKRKDTVGVATGLAWTSFGGDTLSIEVNLMEGSGNIELTGQLGDVMKESAKAAISYIRANADRFGVDSEFYKKYDIHLHVPEGAVPKDGPSAGITIATALISALSGKKISRDVAMTGEITITGRILPIGGLKEKSLAACRAGIKTVLIPEGNTVDIDDVPIEVRQKLTYVPVRSMEKVIEIALTDK